MLKAAEIWSREPKYLRFMNHAQTDEFKGRDLVLAEVEMPRPDENPAVPVWLAPFIDRDVTNDPAFRNFALARQLAGES